MKKKPKATKPRQTRSGVPVRDIWIENDLFDAMEAFRAAQVVEPDKTATIRTALRKFLQDQGFYPPKKGQ